MVLLKAFLVFFSCLTFSIAQSHGNHHPTTPYSPPTPQPPPTLGSCFKNGTQVPGSLCDNNNGRARGVCNCDDNSNTCLQLLAGCSENAPTMEQLSFQPSVPTIIYVGQFYNFTIQISDTTQSSLCFLRPFPEGLSFAQTTRRGSYSLSGTPTVTMPQARYGIAASRSNTGPATIFFNFAVHACPTTAPPTAPPTRPPTAPPTRPPTRPPTAPPTRPPTAPPTRPPTAPPHRPPKTPSPPTPAPVGLEACSNVGYMRCTANEGKYQTCDHGFWQMEQSCQPGLTCQPSGNYIYCV